MTGLSEMSEHALVEVRCTWPRVPGTSLVRLGTSTVVDAAVFADAMARLGRAGSDARMLG
jgi:hypothetical protein